MLRITMLKLRRTWSLAPNIRYRGDTRFPGRLHRLIMLRTAQKSTHTDKDNEWKCKQIIDYLFSPLRTHDEIRRIQSTILADIRRKQRAANKHYKHKEHKDEKYPNKSDHTSPEAQYEECGKIITSIFGEQKLLDSGTVSDTKPEKVKTILSTTAKQIEEKLAQKVEVIDETPLVEAEKPNIEGLNAPPRVLGQNLQPNSCVDCETAIKYNVQHQFKRMIRRLEHSESFSKLKPIRHGVIKYSSDCSNQGGESDETSGKHKQDEYDFIAKRHLNTPNNELDNDLIKEMQKLGVPQGSYNSSVDVGTNTFKKPRKPSANDIELETCKCEHELLTDSIENLYAGTAKKNTIKYLQAIPLSRLFEEGIRYTEEIPQSSKVTEESKINNFQKKLPLNHQKLSIENDKNEIDNVDRQSVSLPSGSQTSQALILLPRVYPWSFMHITLKDLSAIQQLTHSNAYMYTTDRRPPYDPHKSIDQSDNTDIPESSDDKDQKRKKDSELVPNYEGLKLNRDKPYYGKCDISNSFSSQLYNQAWLNHNSQDTTNSLVNDVSSQEMHFNKDFRLERDSLSSEYHQDQNMWSYDNNYQHTTKIIEKYDNNNIADRDIEPFTQVSDTQDTLSNTKAQEYLDIKSTDVVPGAYSEETFQQKILNRNQPYCYEHNYPYSRCSCHQHIWLTSGDDSKDYKNESEDMNSDSDPNHTSINHYTDVNSTYNKSDFVPLGSARDVMKVNESTGPVDQLQGTLITAANTKEHPFGEQIIQESESPLFSQNQYPWRRDFSHIPHQEKTDANPDNIILDQNTDEQAHEYQVGHTLQNSQSPVLYSGDSDTNPDNMILDQNTDEQALEYQVGHTLQNSQSPILYSGDTDTNPDNIAKDGNTDVQTYSMSTTLLHNKYNQINSLPYTPLQEEADVNPDNIILDQNTDGQTYDQIEHAAQDSQALNIYLRQSQISNRDLRDDEYPDKIVIGQVATQLLNERHNVYFHQREIPIIDEKIPENENADNVFLKQDNSNPSSENQQLHPLINQISQNSPNYIIPADENPDLILLDQNTGDPSYKEITHDYEITHDPWINEQFPNFFVARAAAIEQLQNFRYMDNSEKEHDHENHLPSPLHLYPQYQDQLLRNYSPCEGQEESQDTNQSDSLITTANTHKVLYDAHNPILDNISYYERSTIADPVVEAEVREENEDTQSEVTRHISSDPNFQSFSQLYDTETTQMYPYFYHQSYTYFGDVPYHQNYRNIEALLSDQDLMVPDQKTPILATELRPYLPNLQEQESSFQIPAGQSAGFVSIPDVKWKQETLSEPSSKKENVSQVEVPLLEDHNLPLSEVLRRVRQHSRQELMSGCTQVETIEGKCGEPKPPCPPPQKKCPPKRPKCPPKPPPCPRPCKPKCPSPCMPPTPSCPPPPPPPCPPPKPRCKFQSITSEDTIHKILTVIWNLRSSNRICGRPFSNYYFPQSVESSKPITTEEVGTRRFFFGNNLLITYGSDLGSYCRKLETLSLARSFEPWVPVPSWPIPMKKSKKSYVCPKEGCKQRPRGDDPCSRPCYPGNPCRGFPNKYRRH